MIEDMHLRKLAPKTQTCYIRTVKKFADYLGHSPDRATAEDLRQFQLYLTEQGTSRITINATITALRFFFEVTVGDKSIASKLNTVPVPRKLPVVLSREEVSRLLEAAQSLKYKAAFAVAYGAGLRISEVAALKISDIDGERKTLHVEQGKGRKDRYAMLSPVLLDILRRWWREGRDKGLLLDGGCLFPGQDPVNPLNERQLSRAIRAAAAAAEIDKRVSMHLLRHSFATHLLEQKVDIRLIQVLLGHSKLESTSFFTQVATETVQTIAGDPQHLGARTRLTLVLHTWGSAMTHHPHVHGIVTGGGLSTGGERWIGCKPGFFLPVRVLSRLFRRLFLKRLNQAYQADQLRFFGELRAIADADAFSAWIKPLRKIEWVVYAKRPFAGPEAVLAYLSRYTHRVAISNSRLLRFDEQGVTLTWSNRLIPPS